jgi:hypothetical protein
MRNFLYILLLCLIIPAVCFGAPTYYYVNATGGGLVDGSNWTNAFNYTEWEKSVAAIPTGGATNDTYYFVKGSQTYTLTGDFATAGDGIATLPNYIIGVTAETTAEPPTSADYAYGDDRPLITDATNAYVFEFDNYWIIKNIRMEGSDTYCIKADADSEFNNCYAMNDGAATRYGIQTTNGKIIDCESVSTNGNALRVSTGSRILYCYLHDSPVGIEATVNDQVMCASNVIDTCLVGINFDADAINNIVVSNTIWNDNKADAGSIGINAGTGCYGWVIAHNTISGFETPIVFGDTSSASGYMDYNNIYDCTNAATNYPAGPNDKAVDPEFADAAGGNFSLNATSDLINTGIDLLGT